MAGYFLLRSNKNRSTWLPKKVPQNAPFIGSVLVKNPPRGGVLPETTPGHKGVVATEGRHEESQDLLHQSWAKTPERP